MLRNARNRPFRLPQRSRPIPVFNPEVPFYEPEPVGISLAQPKHDDIWNMIQTMNEIQKWMVN